MWVFHGGDLGGGVVFAAVVGASLGLMHAGFTVWLGLSQHVAGIGLTMLASALSFFTFRMLLPSSTTPPRIQAFQPVDLGPLGDLPFVGEALLRHTPLTYRSEEHTSELQSLMRISYAVFCLKKKKNKRVTQS